MHNCYKCGGTGLIPRFGAIRNGMCFKCGGSGKQASAPKTKLTLWHVMGVDLRTGQVVCVYNVKEYSADGAVGKARENFAKASAVFRDTFCLKTAIAIPHNEADNEHSN